ncbi:hypothetical protein [Candidatus Regiella endosymbiont of Tuberolachnus salignus]|uniref:hypothetical protein n=1 Tax=Candidatus Regiella endosymbiont of Tuberolachnus salignus TaxID=3077956 RepID=UPI0030D47863
MIESHSTLDYIPNEFRVTARRPGRPTDEPRHTMKARACSQRRCNLKGGGYRALGILGKRSLQPYPFLV